MVNDKIRVWYTPNDHALKKDEVFVKGSYLMKEFNNPGEAYRWAITRGEGIKVEHITEGSIVLDVTSMPMDETDEQDPIELEARELEDRQLCQG